MCFQKITSAHFPWVGCKCKSACKFQMKTDYLLPFSGLSMATQVAEETIKNVALHFSTVTYALGCLSYRPADSL